MYDHSMSISVVIPTYKGERFLRRLLPALKLQTRPPREIIVIDSSSNDGTIDLATSHGCLTRVIPQAEFNHGGTRNVGARLASGDLLVFMTQDALPADQYLLQNLTADLISGCAVATYARQVPYGDANPLEAYLRMTNYPESSVHSAGDERRGIRSHFFSNVTSAVVREHFFGVGGFPTSVILNEDMILSARLQAAGFRVRYATEATVLHSHNYRLQEQFRRYFDIGVALEAAADEIDTAGSNKEGLRFAIGQIRYVLRRKEWIWVPIAIAETAAKYLGYQMGRRQALLPHAIKMLLSMHKGYWLQTSVRQVPGSLGPMPIEGDTLHREADTLARAADQSM